MHIGFYNPYLNSLSGGERYTLALASHWSKDHNVDVFWDDPNILAKAQERLHLDLTKIRIVPNVFGDGNLLKKLFVSRTYDLIFFLSDGSVPTSLAKHNILHFQMPFTSVTTSAWKLRRYDAIVCNSSFTKDNLDPALQNKAMVIYPPVVTRVFGSSKKEKIILSVGRFHPTKKQEILIDAFQHIFVGWRLVCVGGLLPADTPYFKSLQRKSIGLPIDLVPNCTFDKLQTFYQKAIIYWHATGFGEQDPKLQEHFGISTVEAMAHGCIPIVYKGGGLVEIITEGKSGFLWNTPDELVEKTKQIVNNASLISKISKLCVEQSHDFDEMKFFTAFDELLSQIMS